MEFAFKYRDKDERVKNKGKRLLKMAPLHHHLELSGWRENKVVAVFSLVTLVGAALSILSVMI